MTHTVGESTSLKQSVTRSRVAVVLEQYATESYPNIASPKVKSSGCSGSYFGHLSESSFASNFHYCIYDDMMYYDLIFDI